MLFGNRCQIGIFSVEDRVALPRWQVVGGPGMDTEWRVSIGLACRYRSMGYGSPFGARLATGVIEERIRPEVHGNGPSLAL